MWWCFDSEIRASEFTFLCCSTFWFLAFPCQALGAGSLHCCGTAQKCNCISVHRRGRISLGLGPAVFYVSVPWEELRTDFMFLTKPVATILFCVGFSTKVSVLIVPWVVRGPVLLLQLLFGSDKVVLNSKFTFICSLSVCKEPPYKVEESGYAGFIMPIEVHFKNKVESDFWSSNCFELCQSLKLLDRKTLNYVTVLCVCFLLV